MGNKDQLTKVSEEAVTHGLRRLDNRGAADCLPQIVSRRAICWVGRRVRDYRPVVVYALMAP